MQEFTSISVSSYDAASLADKLTEKSATGWDVVAIVPAGTNITAYLCRDAGSEETASAGGYDAAEPEPIAESSYEDTTPPYVADEVDDVEEVEEPAPAWEPEPVAEEPSVAEPAGWAVAPEPASTAPAYGESAPEATPYLDTSSGYSTAEPAAEAESGSAGEPYLGTPSSGYDTAATTTPEYDTGSVTPEPTSSYDAGTTPEPTSSYDAGTTPEPTSSYDAGTTPEPTSSYDAGTTPEPASSYDAGTTAGYNAGATTDAGISSSTEAAAETQPAATEQAATASAAPAGWYADPAGRFELRYWDGNQWTEHVSRAGQQYTDPPVA
jgi:hypothetical protein